MVVGIFLVDVEQVRVLEHEELSELVLDQALEGVGGGPDVLFAAVDGLEAGQVDVVAAAPVLQLLQAVDVIQQQVFLAGQSRLGHQMMPLAIMASTTVSM